MARYALLMMCVAAWTTTASAEWEYFDLCYDTSESNRSYSCSYNGEEIATAWYTEDNSTYDADYSTSDITVPCRELVREHDRDPNAGEIQGGCDVHFSIWYDGNSKRGDQVLTRGIHGESNWEGLNFTEGQWRAHQSVAHLAVDSLTCWCRQFHDDIF